jgi:uncharacterized protein DUF4412
MKKTFVVILSLLFVVSAFAAKGLVIKQKVAGGMSSDANITITWYVSETQCKMKMEYHDEKLNSVNDFIPDLASGKLLMYNEGSPAKGGNPTYFAIPQSEIKGGEGMPAQVTLTRTGETKTILGIACEKMVVKSSNSTTEMWVTTDFKADYYKFAPFFRGSYELLALSQQNIQGVPLQSTTKDNSGKILSSTELISASLTDISAAEFSVPSGYSAAAGADSK